MANNNSNNYKTITVQKLSTLVGEGTQYEVSSHIHNYKQMIHSLSNCRQQCAESLYI